MHQPPINLSSSVSVTYKRGRFRRGPAVLALAISILLAACGGGGGGGDPPPGGGGGGSGGGAGPSGTLWSNSPIPASGSSSKLSGFTGAPTQIVDNNSTAVPVRDGTRYATFDYNFLPSENNTTVAVKNRVTGAVISSALLNGYVYNLRPSPVAANLLLVTWSTSPTTNDPEEIVLDLAQRRIVEVLGGANTAANWFADGSYLLLLENGRLFRASAGGVRTAAGQVTVADRVPRGLWISPNDTEVLTLWRTVRGQQILKDLWISDVNGARLARWTATDQSDNPVWSPDGRFVGYRNVADRLCEGFSCPIPDCGISYAATGSRDLAFADPRANDFRVVDSSGSRTVTLSCQLNGWTP